MILTSVEPTPNRIPIRAVRVSKRFLRYETQNRSLTVAALFGFGIASSVPQR
jgi:hypothetical protein